MTIKNTQGKFITDDRVVDIISDMVVNGESINEIDGHKVTVVSIEDDVITVEVTWAW